jgi:hypothetical protein
MMSDEVLAHMIAELMPRIASATMDRIAENGVNLQDPMVDLFLTADVTMWIIHDALLSRAQSRKKCAQLLQVKGVDMSAMVKLLSASGDLLLARKVVQALGLEV